MDKYTAKTFKQILIATMIICVVVLILAYCPLTRDKFKAFDGAWHQYRHGHPPKEMTWEERKQYGYAFIAQIGIWAVLFGGAKLGDWYCARKKRLAQQRHR